MILVAAGNTIMHAGMQSDAEHRVYLVVINQDQMIRSKKQYHRYFRDLYSIPKHCILYRIQLPVFPRYKGHTRQGTASSPLAVVVTASFVRHFFLRCFLFFFCSSLLLLLFFSLSTPNSQRIHSPLSCSPTCSLSLALLRRVPVRPPPSDLFAALRFP